MEKDELSRENILTGPAARNLVVVNQISLPNIKVTGLRKMVA